MKKNKSRFALLLLSLVLSLSVFASAAFADSGKALGLGKVPIPSQKLFSISYSFGKGVNVSLQDTHLYAEGAQATVLWPKSFVAPKGKKFDGWVDIDTKQFIPAYTSKIIRVSKNIKFEAKYSQTELSPTINPPSTSNPDKNEISDQKIENKSSGKAAKKATSKTQSKTTAANTRSEQAEADLWSIPSTKTMLSVLSDQKIPLASPFEGISALLAGNASSDEIRSANASAVISAAKQSGVPLVPLMGSDIALNTPENSGLATWSLSNLICAILSIAIFAISASYLFIRNAKKNGDFDEDDDAEDINALLLGVDAEGRPIYANNNAEKVQSVIKKRVVNVIRHPFLIISALAAIASLLFFVLTQNTDSPLVIFDGFSIGFVVLLLIVVCSSVLTFGKRTEEVKVNI